MKNILPIILRHVFVLVNGVIFAVVLLLFVFGEKQSALFIGIIVVINILLGMIQDTRARFALEKLQLLTALRVIRINNDGTEEIIFAENVTKGDKIRLKLGDQVSCDGELISGNGLEVSTALITGESDSFPRAKGDKLNGGEIITAGTGIVIAKSDFKNSRLSKMTEDAKEYAAKPSPIQNATEKIISWSGYALIGCLLFVIIRGYLLDKPTIEIVNTIGALASTLVPQGLVVITTLLFALGASTYSGSHVLFQEINATEKLGRIKNLCMDKTGTLTENNLIVEALLIPSGGSLEEARILALDYIRGSGESSQVITAINNYLKANKTETNNLFIDALPFSSWRQYGAVRISKARKKTIILIGAPDAFIPYLATNKEQHWLEQQIKDHGKRGERLVAIAESSATELPHNLKEARLKISGIYVFLSELRPGISTAIKFFQDRGVKIRIISGDHPDTVQAVAAMAGVDGTEFVVTGDELEKWDKDGFDGLVKKHTIFARIVPEQKVRIIEAFKRDGFTAMVGDGANDALAIKKADLGIAMFDGAPATRKLASVILMNNSFTALPGGVRLADNFIRNIEIFTAIFINQSILGFLFFVIISILGYTYPLLPLNITIVNYFTLGLPGILISYWAIRPLGKVFPVDSSSFLSRVIPFVFTCAIIEAIGTTIIFLLSQSYLHTSIINPIIALSYAVFGFIFFALSPLVYRGAVTFRERIDLLVVGIFELGLLAFVLNTPAVVDFFRISMVYPEFPEIYSMFAIFFFFGCILFALRKFFLTDNNYFVEQNINS
ncbi:MAG: HAD-IC family P-type ATPase, partial [bacterium]|nr:HAD-IC family P-type ATPase [bacterium]